MASQQESGGDRNEKPLVSINRYRVRQLDPLKKESQFGNEAGGAAVAGVDMQPEVFVLANLADGANRVHRTRACCADGCYHCKR